LFGRRSRNSKRERVVIKEEGKVRERDGTAFEKEREPGRRFGINESVRIDRRRAGKSGIITTIDIAKIRSIRSDPIQTTQPQ
jgi:hypothetical protein